MKLPGHSAELGARLLQLLSILHPPPSILVSCRGLGLMAGVELRLPDGKPATKATMQAIKEMLHRGFILLPEGEHANVISFTPPLTIAKTQLAKAVEALAEILKHE